MTITAIEKARDKKRKLSQQRTARSEHNLVLKHLANPSSKKMAIDAFCFCCVGGTVNELPDPGYKEMIRTCTSFVCPLRSHRPYKNKEEHE